ncbi:Phenylalanine--tRNA ligase beta subunit [Mycena venus]|uniref:Phenylalanine--tRNA ligase beta subunit n=1 Tax=Mycena venus TaxID=2733690 RepID=A0A8H6Y491_9AGAR|nr:Phenylalanine--tRNA ligase beta subunit [Mycena venus]
MFNLNTIAIVGLAVAATASATCPGFNFGIIDTHQKFLDANKWVVVDDSCNVVDSLITDQNPCTQGIFSCGPGPVFDGYTSTTSGLHYACRPDPNSGSCDGLGGVQVCANDKFGFSAVTTETEQAGSS